MKNIKAKIYDSSYKRKPDLWLLKWIVLVFVIIEFHWINTTPASKAGIVLFSEIFYFAYALLSTIFLRNKLSFNSQILNLIIDFLVITFFIFLSLSIFVSGSRIHFLYIIPIIYCGYWFSRLFTFIFATLVSAAYFLLNYFTLLSGIEKSLIISEIKGTLIPVVFIYYCAVLLIFYLKDKILSYFVEAGQGLSEQIVYALSKTASTFDHNIKNAISTITLYTSALIDDTESTSPQYFPLTQVKKKIYDISEEINFYRSSIKLDTPKKETVKIESIIDEMEFEIQSTIDKKKIKLETEVTPDIPEIEVDPVLLKTVFRNLVRNSVDAMPDEGKIYLSVTASRKTLLIDWRDTGCGISPEDTAKIFDLLWTKKVNNYGLGLFQAKAIIERHHKGSLLQDPNYKKGARFLIELPLKRKK